VSLVAFAPEEQVEAFGETYTLRLDFRAISVIEGTLDMSLRDVCVHLRSGNPPVGLLSRVLWAMLREWNPEVTIDQALAIVMTPGKEAAQFGMALDSLLERAFPLQAEGREKPNPPKSSRGRSKSSAASG
jgi:hypothetical protein